MSLPVVDINSLKAKSKEFDYIRFTLSDINGIPRGKTISGRFADRFLENGFGFYTGIIAFGPQCEPPTIPVFAAGGHSNILARPASNIYELPWCNYKNKRVGEVLCEPVWDDGKIQRASPRYIVRKQLEALSAMGLKLYSSFELEFMVVEKETLKPIFDGAHAAPVFTYSKHATMFEEFDEKMKVSGIDVETFQVEFSPGQFEMAFDPKYGIGTADMMFKFKEAMKEMCYQKGYQASFMTRPFAASACSNGAHFNFSLWNEAGENALYDASKSDNLSETAKYFIGGLMKHLKAVTAICCPTANCYRRLHQPWAPDNIDWAIKNREMSVRVINLSEKSTYFENRIPSGSCNPYLATAATLAAGIDGIQNKIEPHKMGEHLESLPHSLEEALEGLKSDEYMTKALGEEFVDWFISMKNDVDICKFGKHDMKSENQEEVEAERKEYFEFM